MGGAVTSCCTEDPKPTKTENKSPGIQKITSKDKEKLNAER